MKVHIGDLDSLHLECCVVGGGRLLPVLDIVSGNDDRSLGVWIFPRQPLNPGHVVERMRFARRHQVWSFRGNIAGEKCAGQHFPAHGERKDRANRGATQHHYHFYVVLQC